MATIRTSLLIACVTAAMLVPISDAFARGGRGGGGGGRGGGGGGGRGGGGMGGGGGGGSQMPAPPPKPENPTITADKKEITTLQTALDKANKAYTDAVAKVTKEFQAQPDYVAAQKTVDDANKEVDAARDSCIANLKTQPDYKAATAKETAARAKLDQLKANGASRDAVSAQSSEILKIGGESSKIEREALSKDSKYNDALKKLADARTALQSQKDVLAAQIKDDKDIAPLKATVDESTTKLADARTKLATDQKANP